MGGTGPNLGKTVRIDKVRTTDLKPGTSYIKKGGSAGVCISAGLFSACAKVFCTSPEQPILSPLTEWFSCSQV